MYKIVKLWAHSHSLKLLKYASITSRSCWVRSTIVPSTANRIMKKLRLLYLEIWWCICSAFGDTISNLLMKLTWKININSYQFLIASDLWQLIPKDTVRFPYLFITELVQINNSDPFVHLSIVSTCISFGQALTDFCCFSISISKKKTQDGFQIVVIFQVLIKTSLPLLVLILK